MSESPVRAARERDGRLLRLALARPKANVLDEAMIAALGAALDREAGDPRLGAILLSHEGPHFSFGASVEEHMPGRFAAMLRGFHALILRLATSPIPVLVAIRGQCLGGGLELAAAGHLLFAAPDAKLGQPEIQLGVFAPAASCLLPERIGPAAAEDLLLSGRSIGAAEAATLGLVTAVAEDPEAAARDYFERHLAPKSARALRFALRAARMGLVERLAAKLAAVEALYRDELMQSRDAVEGLEAFVAKRQPAWEHR
ncbi:MAG: cyclohexa-1,5-dienecarbonyl-CoA hydratase [Alphaproteobacteria bacterium]|nr:cyclohexa-1,5-dienecarbonyl-CoA hydratase [Alphaproteobacteria bacterium]